MIRQRKDIKLAGQIAKGGFGRVFEASDVRTNKALAVKIVDREKGGKHEELLRREIKAMQTLKNENIIPLKGLILEATQVLIVMPRMHGSLRRLGFLSTSREDHVAILHKLMFQMLSALKYLDAKNMCHRDVKPDNILYDIRQGSHRFQLADFGLVNTVAQAGTFCGTPIYWAPEMVKEPSRQTSKVDIWSLFVTLAYVLSHINEKTLGVKAPQEVVKAVLDIARLYPRLQSMAQEDPASRASAADILRNNKDIFSEQQYEQHVVQKPKQVKRVASSPEMQLGNPPLIDRNDVVHPNKPGPAFEADYNIPPQVLPAIMARNDVMNPHRLELAFERDHSTPPQVFPPLMGRNDVMHPNKLGLAFEADDIPRSGDSLFNLGRLNRARTPSLARQEPTARLPRRALATAAGPVTSFPQPGPPLGSEPPCGHWFGIKASDKGHVGGHNFGSPDHLTGCPINCKGRPIRPYRPPQPPAPFVNPYPPGHPLREVLGPSQEELPAFGLLYRPRG